MNYNTFDAAEARKLAGDYIDPFLKSILVKIEKHATAGDRYLVYNIHELDIVKMLRSRGFTVNETAIKNRYDITW